MTETGDPVEQGAKDQGLMPNLISDFETEMDLDALTRAKKVTADVGRLKNARRLAERREEEAAEIVRSMPGKAARRFNGTVRGSSMVKSR